MGMGLIGLFVVASAIWRPVHTGSLYMQRRTCQFPAQLNSPATSPVSRKYVLSGGSDKVADLPGALPHPMFRVDPIAILQQFPS